MVAEKCLMVADNVGFHKTTSVKAAYNEEGWLSENLPPNMTDELQPMDLVVNRTFKSIMRKKRAMDIYDYLQAYRNLLNQYYNRKGMGELDVNNPYPIWTPPKSNYKKAVIDVFNCVHNDLNNETFQRSMTKCFVDVGLLRPVDQYKANTNYVNYCRKKLGYASLKVSEDLSEGDCIAGWIIDFVQRADQADNDEAVEEESDHDSINGNEQSLAEESNNEEPADDDEQPADDDEESADDDEEPTGDVEDSQVDVAEPPAAIQSVADASINPKVRVQRTKRPYDCRDTMSTVWNRWKK